MTHQNNSEGIWEATSSSSTLSSCMLGSSPDLSCILLTIYGRGIPVAETIIHPLRRAPTTSRRQSTASSRSRNHSPQNSAPLAHSLEGCPLVQKECPSDPVDGSALSPAPHLSRWASSRTAMARLADGRPEYYHPHAAATAAALRKLASFRYTYKIAWGEGVDSNFQTRSLQVERELFRQ